MNSKSDQQQFDTSNPLDNEVCRRARMARDSRFDGEFFVGVTSTGIYCRPICPARQPAEKNVEYFRHATQAAESGFRPCLRCRPETAPNCPAWLGSATTLQRALELIRAGALNGDNTLQQLADRLGIGERYLRKLFQRELGVSPLAVAQNQRLLLAKQLLLETQLPLTETAFAAGFGSIRRFNSAIQSAFGMPPSQMRRRRSGSTRNDSIKLELHYRPPYDWNGVISVFARHAVEGIETVTADSYSLRFALQGYIGELTVRPLKHKHALGLTLQLNAILPLMPIIERVRRMFDLDANPEIIAQHLSSDPTLAILLRRYPGIRSPVKWSPEEAAIRAIVGQQVSTLAARSICARLASAVQPNVELRTFPSPADIALLSDGHFPMPGRRRDTLKRLASTAVNNGELDPEGFAAAKGIGPWTTAMLAMRGYGNPDAFPESDLGLIQAWEKLNQTLKLKEASKRWGPWRSYAANLLWRTL
jgi:AraC family transcriptional regulator of adaptative response / DNA-3-methyladenine glycosylase II